MKLDLIDFYENKQNKLKRELEELNEVGKKSPKRLKEIKEIDLILEGLNADKIISELRKENHELKRRLEKEGIDIYV